MKKATFHQPAKHSIELPRILISSEANFFEKTKGQFGLEHGYPEKMFGFRTKGITKKNELDQSSMKPLKRRKSCSGWKVTNLEERKSFFRKLVSFERKKVRLHTISGHPEQGTENNDGIKARTFSFKTLGSYHLPIRRVSSSPPYSDCLACFNSAVNPSVPHEINSAQRLEEEINRRSWTARNVNMPASLHCSWGSPTKEREKRNSRILVKRFELELAINKDDRRRLLSAIKCKTVDLNERDYYGKTLLHTATSVGNHHCAQILINAGADVNLQDQAGFTPLHCAVVSNHVPCAAVLISSGADLMAHTKTMHTALTLAHEDEMILLIGRSLLLRETLPSQRLEKDSNRSASLRETNL